MNITTQQAAKLARQASELLPVGTRVTRKQLRRVARKIRKILPATFAPVRNFDLEQYMADKVFVEEAKEFLRKAFQAPSRHLTNYISHNIHFPLVRFGVALKAESRDLEFAIMLIIAMRTDVVAIAEQLPQLPKIDLEGGGWTAPKHDLIVLTKDRVEVYEIRSRARLARATLRQRHVYRLKGNDYVCPEIAAFYENWGFKFAVKTEDNIDPNFVRSVKPLLPYQTGSPEQPITPEEQQSFCDWVAQHPGRRLVEMPMERQRRNELVHYFLARCAVFTRLTEVDWDNPDAIRLYLTPQDEAAFHHFLMGARRRPADLRELGYYLRQGSLVEIDNIEYRVERLGSETLQLREIKSEKLTDPLPFRALLDLRPLIGHIVDAEKTFETLFEEASPEDRAVYFARCLSIEPFLPGGNRAGKSPKDRTIRHYCERWKQLEQNGRCGDEALLSGYYRCGRRPAKWTAEANKAYLDCVDRLLLQPRDAKVKWLIDELETKVAADKLPSKRRIYRRIQKEVDKWHRQRSVVGLSGALDQQPLYGDSPIHGPSHGGRAGLRAHGDATPVAVSQPDGLWVSRIVDDFTGKVLADIQYKGHPNARTQRELILECVARNGWLASEMSLDGGSENSVTWMQATLLGFNVRLDYRRRKHPRDGGAVESSFYGELARLLSSLPANTKHEAEYKLLDDAYRAKNFELLTAEELKEIRTAYVALVNKTPRQNGMPSPEALEVASITEFGPPPRQMPTVRQLQQVLLPFVPGRGGRRKVSTRGSIRCLRRTWGIIGQANPLRKYAGKSFFVRYQPENADAVWIYAESPTKAMKLVPITRKGPSARIMAVAKEYDAKRLANDGPLPTVYSIAQPVIAKAVARQARERKSATAVKAQARRSSQGVAAAAVAPIAF